jgi:hypothetical protein
MEEKTFLGQLGLVPDPVVRRGLLSTAGGSPANDSSGHCRLGRHLLFESGSGGPRGFLAGHTFLFREKE